MATVVEFIDCAKAGVARPLAAARVAAFHHEQGRRVLIRADGDAQAQALDQALWTFDSDSFLPHAPAGGQDQAGEPVLISQGRDNPNRAQVLILASGHQEPPVTGFDFVIQLLPEEPGPELDACRQAFVALKQAGQVDLRYLNSV